MAPPASTDVFTNMFQFILVDLKASPQLWENICSKAVKLATQLSNLANSLGSFINAMQSISDNASNTKGASRDIGASLTRFCLRQKSLENLLRAFATALSESFAPSVEHKVSEWRQRVNEIERRRTRALKKLKQKSSICSEESKSIFAELLTEQRNHFIFFVNALLPVANAELDVLGESAHVQEVRDSLASAANETDTHTIIEAILEDAQINVNSNSTIAGNSCTNSMESVWQRRISTCSGSETLSKSASQSLQAMMEDEQKLKNIFGDSYQSQQLPSSSSSISSSGISLSLHDPYGTIHTNSSSGGGTTFAGRKDMELCGDNSSQFTSRPRTLTSISSAGGDNRRIPITAQTFVPPTHFANHKNLHSYNQQQNPHTSSPTSLANSPINSKPPLPIRQRSLASTTENSIYSDSLRNDMSNVYTNLSLSTNDISVGATVRECHMNGQTTAEIASAVSRRPLSLSEELSNQPNGLTNSTPGHCSTLLIAETLQQIDQLGVELDSYCQTLKPIATQRGENVLQLVNNPSSDIFVQQNSLMQKQPSSINQVLSQHTNSANMAAVRYRPTNAKQPPPLPERRNSTISAVTTQSSMDIRNNGNPAMHTYQIAYPNTKVVQLNHTFSQIHANQHGNVPNFETRKSAQQFDQYNPSRSSQLDHSTAECPQNVQYYSQEQLRQFENA